MLVAFTKNRFVKSRKPAQGAALFPGLAQEPRRVVADRFMAHHVTHGGVGKFAGALEVLRPEQARLRTAVQGLSRPLPEHVAHLVAGHRGDGRTDDDDGDVEVDGARAAGRRQQPGADEGDGEGTPLHQLAPVGQQGQQDRAREGDEGDDGQDGVVYIHRVFFVSFGGAKTGSCIERFSLVHPDGSAEDHDE